MYANETIWCTQDAIAALFDKGRSTITEHLQNAFSTGELVKESVCRKFRRTASDGKQYNTQYYNLDAVISVGYRVNSIRATQFRQWATGLLRQYAIREGWRSDFTVKRRFFWWQRYEKKSIRSKKVRKMQSLAVTILCFRRSHLLKAGKLLLRPQRHENSS